MSGSVALQHQQHRVSLGTDGSHSDALRTVAALDASERGWNTHTFTHSLTHSLTHFLTHSLTHQSLK